MIDDKELHDLMNSVAQKSLQMIANFQDKPEHLPALIQQLIHLTEHFQSLLAVFLQNPEQVWEMQINYWHHALELAHNQFTSWLEGKTLPINDKRFASEEWVSNPFFNLLCQQYILASDHLNTLLHKIEYTDKNSAKKLRFFMKQYLDALSPANFAHTNPQIMAETISSRGKNLLRGLHNLLSDLEHDAVNLSIKMTDTSAYEIGVNLATTPGKVIFRNEMMELIQYSAQTSKVKAVPLLMVPPWINKYYILDLSAHNSLVRWLVQHGITVFIISWVNPDSRFAKKSFYDYLNEGPHTAIEVIKNQLNVKQVNTLGFCIGGTLLASLLAYHKAIGNKSIRSATFLAAMIDFSDPGDISVFIDEQQIQKLEKEMESKGYLAGRFMASSFNALRANDLIWSFFIKNYLQGKNPIPFDILYWNGDSTNMPATMHSQYLRWMYLHNDLVKPGKIRLNNIPIDVTQIDIPTFFLSTEKDHIAPWETTYLGFQLMKGPKRFVLGGSGHIAGIINSPESVKYGYKTNELSPKQASKWLAGATEHRGSWWPEWLRWLKPNSGKTITAPNINDLPFPELGDAPGEYVLEKHS